LATNQGTCETEISSIFKDAIFNLEKIDTSKEWKEANYHTAGKRSWRNDSYRW